MPAKVLLRTAYAIALPDVAPVASSATTNIAVTMLLVIHLLCLLPSMSLGLFSVYIVQSLGLNQLVNLQQAYSIGSSLSRVPSVRGTIQELNSHQQRNAPQYMQALAVVQRTSAAAMPAKSSLAKA